MPSPTKRASAGILVALLVAQILCACSARGEGQGPAGEQSPTAPKIQVQSLEFHVGMPLYRIRRAPDVLIPGFKVSELYVDNNA